MIPMPEVRNPKWNEFGTINCEINHPEWGWLSFTATPDDLEEHGRIIFQNAVNGDYGPIAPYAPDIENIRSQALYVYIYARYRTEFDAISLDPIEVPTLYKQEAEAQAFTADPNAPTPFLDACVAVYPSLEGTTPEEKKLTLVTQINDKLAIYDIDYGTVVGKYKELIYLVNTATTLEEIYNVVPELAPIPPRISEV